MDEKTKKRFEFPETDEEGKKYLTNIDTICKKCGYHNIGKYELDEDMPVVCCGECGAFLVVPEGMSEEDKKAMQLCVQQAIEDQKEEDKANRGKKK